MENIELNEYEQSMVDKVDDNTTKVEDSLKTDEEKMYAGKYNSVEDLEKAYSELQKKLGSNTSNETVEETVEENNDNATQKVEETTNEEEAKTIVEDKGFNFEELSKEYMTNGDLSEETYNKLAEAGIPKEMVDSYVAGQQAILNEKVQAIYSTIGGEQEYNNMIEWASENLTDGEKEAFNSAIGMNDNVAQFTIQSLYSRYKSNTPGNLINGDSKSSTGNGGYETKMEMMRDMNSIEYKKDPQFRAIVQKKVANTKWM